MSRPLYLIDTHVLLWAVSDDSRLSRSQRAILQQGNGLIVSVASIWEIAIKRALGKLVLDGDIVDTVRAHNIPFLAVNELHAARTEQLGDHHRAPFDRMLIAQAQMENLTILTSDKIFSQYDVTVI
ncbi:type II toxin-antitoxin system VapC family toxin [Phyllobacterium zundukense]|uniref:Twitching motility protein PilT n=1 Tax=Phyllobacterium zundukense TaxID=1867719 RepID=A0A2N9VXN5_9HYPH|nr:type II toxin-antitoxin system VapC family toxin [Phyllobacterium zundukense]ATU95746.1 twitching motility protein PilT [Phyllobacterium zundukense]PIO44253.1 twitching motility protein PilT [Phyllobacterium zundukense]